MNTTTKLSARKWITLILIGLFGQFAWTIENMYFNVFLYNTISTDPWYIAEMVGCRRNADDASDGRTVG